MRSRMQVASLGLTVAVLAAVCLVAAPAAAATVTQAYLVTFEPGANPDEEAAQLRAKGHVVSHVYRHVLSGVAVRMPSVAVAAVRADVDVKRVVADAAVTISDVRADATWGLDRSDQRALPLDGSFSHRSSAGAGVYAYIVDTGIRSTHEQFGGRVAAGYTAITDGRGTDDCHGHGTHVAGTVAGRTYGLANQATLVPVRVLDCGGSGYWSSVIAGLDYVAGDTTRRPAVVNLSLGGYVDSAVNAAVQAAVGSGVTVVVAAGNEGDDACNVTPASAPSAITVGATTSADGRAGFSNHGGCVDMFAPGVSITSSTSASDSASVAWSGTSMASPHVAGAVALILGAAPDLTPAEVTATLLAEATTGVVLGAGERSPNLLLYADPGPLASAPLVPPNDAFAAAEVVTVSGLHSASTWRATKEPGEPNHAGVAGQGSIWYSFTAPADGVATFSTQGSSFDTLLAVYSGEEFASLVTEGSNDDRPDGSRWSEVVLPVAAGSTYRVAVDGYGSHKGSVSLALVYNNDVTVLSRQLLPATAGAAYAGQLDAAGGSGSYTWSLEAGSSLPAGLSLSSAGVLAGTPTVYGDYSFTVAATDGSTSGTATVNLTVKNAPPANDPFESPEVLPVGLGNSSGSVDNSTGGATVQADEPVHAGYGLGHSVWYQLTSVSNGVVTLSTSGSAFDTVMAVYTGNALVSLTSVVSNDDAPGGLWSDVRFSAVAGTTYQVAIDGYNYATGTARGALTLGWTFTLSLAVSNTSLPTAVTGTPYSTQLNATGGDGNYSWSLAAGSLPAGLSLGANGTIAGTPSAAGTSSFTVLVESAAATATKGLSMAVLNPVSVSTSSLASGVVGTAYSAQLAAAGGQGPYLWSLESGSNLPAGLALSTTGAISGAPSLEGTDTFTVKATDRAGRTASRALSLRVYAPLSISTASLPAGVRGVPYSAQLGATGASGNYSWSLAAGSLPAGLSLGSNGTISGTPTSAATSLITVRVTSHTAVATKSLSLTVSAPALPGFFVKTTPAPNAMHVSRFSVSFSWAPSPGAATYEFCLSKTASCNSSGGTGWISTGTATSIVRTGLAKATYYWQVRAVNLGGATLSNNGTWWKFSRRT